MTNWSGLGKTRNCTLQCFSSSLPLWPQESWSWQRFLRSRIFQHKTDNHRKEQTANLLKKGEGKKKKKKRSGNDFQYETYFQVSRKKDKMRVSFGKEREKQKMRDRGERRQTFCPALSVSSFKISPIPKRDVTRDDSWRRFLAQHSVTTLFRSFAALSNIAKLCCAKNRCCESSRLTSP